MLVVNNPVVLREQISQWRREGRAIAFVPTMGNLHQGHLTRNGVPVCGHLGLTPQSVHVFGGFKVQGRDEFHAQEIYRQALELQAAGIQLLVLECVPVALAERISKALRIPVIGIGAGPATDGQILVMHDAFGITSGYVPKFTKNFLAETGDMRAAIRLYVQQVSEGTFPGPEHCFN